MIYGTAHTKGYSIGGASFDPHLTKVKHVVYEMLVNQVSLLGI